jgi:hypothetical protein
MYFFDPDGVLLEFAAWTRELGPDEAQLTGVGAGEKGAYLERQGECLAALKKARESNTRPPR